jgi:hypothetical protein
VLGGLTATDCVSLATQGGEVHALTRTGLVFESLDGGATWAAKGSITTSDAVEIVRAGNALHVVTGAGDSWLSTDAGASWLAVGTISQVGASGLVRDGSMLAAVTREGLVARSPDGSAWTWVGTVNQVNVVGLATDAPVVSVPDAGPRASRLSLGAVWPNPVRGFRSAWTFPVTLTARASVQVSLYDVSGRRVATRPVELLEGPGSFRITWAPGDLPGGVYGAEVRAGAMRATRRVVVLE